MNRFSQTIKGIMSGRIMKSILIYLSVIVVFVFLYKSVGFYYEANDDTSMMRIAAGGYTGVMDGHLMFIRYALGVIIAKLFELMPTIDWYGGMMLFILSFCVWLILDRILKLTMGIKKAAYVRVFSILYLAALILLDVIFFQFTTVSGMVAATILFLMATDSERDIKVSRVILYVALLFIVHAIRKKVLFMISPFILFIIGMDILMVAYKGNYSLTISGMKTIVQDHSKRLLFYFSVVLLALMSFVVVEKNNDSAYSTEEWSECKSYVHYRSRIVDYDGFPSYDENEELWNSIEVSPEAYAIFGKTFGIMPDIDADDLEKIAEMADEKTISAKEVSHVFFENVLNGGYTHYKSCLVLILFIAILFCTRKDIVIWEKLKFIGLLGISFVELIYLLLNGRMPERVMFVWILATIAGIGGVALRLCVEYESRDNGIKMNKGMFRNKRLRMSVLVLLVLMMFVNTAVTTNNKLVNYKEALLAYEEYKEYLKAHSDTIFVVNTGTVNSRKQFNIFREVADKENTIGTRGWSSSLPMLSEWKKEQGLDTNQFPLCQEGVVYLTADTSYLPLMDVYMKSIGCSSGYRIVDEVSLSNGKIIIVASWN